MCVCVCVSWTLLAFSLHATQAHLGFFCISFIWLPEHDSKAYVGYI